MSWELILITSILGLIIAGMVWNWLENTIQERKNPHLTYDFIESLNLSEETKIIEINDRIELHLRNGLLYHMDVFVKNNQNEFIKVEHRSYYRGSTNIILFEDPWHIEIAEQLKQLYNQQKIQQQQEEQEQETEIEMIKRTWS